MSGPQIELESASFFWKRLRGLIGRPKLGPARGLIFPRCRAVHGFFLGRPVDCAFLDGSNRVLAVAVLNPWKVLFGPAGTAAVVEMDAGEAARLGLEPGCVLLPGSGERWVVARLPTGPGNAR